MPPRKKKNETEAAVVKAPDQYLLPADRSANLARMEESPEERMTRINGLVKTLNGSYGKGTIFAGQYVESAHAGVIPTGSLGLDLATGIGGIPRGRMTEIYGAESTGKTTLAYHIIGQAQKLGGVAAYIDLEHAIEPEYAAICGVNMNEMMVSQPTNGEEALQIAETLTESGQVDLIVIDSVAAIVTTAEASQHIGKAQVAGAPRLLAQAVRKLTPIASRNQVAIVFINQVRMNIGTYGNPETTPGGRAIRHWASLRIRMSRIEAVKSGNEIIGNRVRAECRKNKVATPYRKAEFSIYFTHGIRKSLETLEHGNELGIIRKAGSNFYHHGEILGRSREGAAAFLEEQTEIHQELIRQITAASKAGKTPQPEDFPQEPPKDAAAPTPATETVTQGAS